MQVLLDEIEGALQAELYTMAMMGALSVPDIAAALESPDGTTSRKRYIDWFEAHANLHLEESRAFRLTGENCYRFRCALLHQGSVEDQRDDPHRFKRLLFFPLRGNVWGHMNAFGDALQINIPLFCRAMIAAASRRIRALRGTEPFETNLARSVQLRPNGMAPYVVGYPVIG